MSSPLPLNQYVILRNLLVQLIMYIRTCTYVHTQLIIMYQLYICIPTYILLKVNECFINTYIASVVLVRFNPATYTVTEGVDANAVITLETIGAHSDVINVTVIARSGNATRALIYVCCI